MADRGLGEDAPAPSQPPMLGASPPGDPDWAAQVQQMMSQHVAAQNGGQQPQGSLDMSFDQFQGLPGPQQRQLLNLLVPMGADPGIVPWDSNDPKGAPNLVSQLWYAAPEASRKRFLEPNPNYPDVSFANAMLGPELQPANTHDITPVPPVPYGHGDWEQSQNTTGRGPQLNWLFNKKTQPELDAALAQGRLPMGIVPSFEPSGRPRPPMRRTVTGQDRNGPIFGAPEPII